jgi:DNA segregation ATPase FtsK/SpoIIIE, S-DNA-T family
MNADPFDSRLDRLLAETIQEAREVGRLAPGVQQVLDAHGRTGAAASALRVRRELRALIEVSADPKDPAGVESLPASAPWSHPLWPHSLPAKAGSELPRWSRIGEFHCSLPGDSPEMQEVLPALVPILGGGNLLLLPKSEGMPLARKAAASLAVRLLATAVPGSLWVYPIDPLLAGDSFMELAPFGDEVVRKHRHEGASVGSNRDIERLLDELSKHIEEVKTRLPRARHQNLEEYNADPGGTPIPYRLLLVSDFPYGFDAKAAEQLVHIARNGPRAGVHLVVVVNQEVEQPHGFRLDTLSAWCLVAGQRSASAFFLQHATLERADLHLDSLPPATEMAPAEWEAGEWAELRLQGVPPANDKWIHRLAMIVNARARETRNVQVLLEGFRPRDESGQFAPWLQKSDSKICTPIGRSAERKPQDFELNEGGLPHAFVSGGTGRGKTVLLNAMVLGLCWRYSPEELELYLIDFKDGLGFQGFRDLPHARLVALQGERELGVQVLRDIEKKMRERGTAFKSVRSADGATVNNLARWREATGKPMPRVLIVFDEFQALLRGNDSLATEAATLLATVAGLGREFGFHIVLSTQTPRQSGITPAIQSQLATRVTLFLEELDSQIVLSPRNSAAATLHGVGEAIYNNAGGQPEGNHRFQVAFAEKSSAIPRAVAELIALANDRFPGRQPPRVLDGGLPPLPSQGEKIAAALVTPPVTVPRSLRAYLGAPVDLDTEHVHMTLQPRGQAHLLIFGRNGMDEDGQDCEPMALVVGAMATSALQTPRIMLRLASLLSDDSPLFQLPAMLERVRGDIQVGAEPELKVWLEEIATEIDRRLSSPGLPRDFLLLGVLALHRAGFLDGGMRPPPLQEKLRHILREGPEVGVHVLAHVDDAAGLARRLGDSERREFGTRVAARGSIGRKLFELTRASPEDVAPGRAWLDRVEQPGPSRRLRTYGREVFIWLQSLQ